MRIYNMKHKLLIAVTLILAVALIFILICCIPVTSNVDVVLYGSLISDETGVVVNGNVRFCLEGKQRDYLVTLFNKNALDVSVTLDSMGVSEIRFSNIKAGLSDSDDIALTAGTYYDATGFYRSTTLFYTEAFDVFMLPLPWEGVTCFAAIDRSMEPDALRDLFADYITGDDFWNT